MNNRLLQFLAAENINQSQFADSIGVARASISHILAGRNKPGYDFIENTMKRYPALNIEWLLTGRGRMYKSAETTEETPSLFTAETASSQQQTDRAAVPTPPAETAIQTALHQSAGRRISKIIVFFDDNSFQEFNSL